ncbi:LppC [Actinobacillus ureae ATCC 25976]|uniref:Penicillin-binding protein activator LpoA n=1 Tax=Actinobacillus ureae ATCC 25976 TaxID=887324 RepID=E8KK92_9PAST|nr:penicillin-binding protein activator [Actinobacillus ureae]EFX90693.1 LppC [Actinobacillus ureae ATCC 25976]
MATILKQKLKTVFVPTAMALFLSACTGTSFFENPLTKTVKNEAYATSEFYINKAEQATDKEDKITYRLLAIRKLIDENKAFEAQNMFDELNASLAEIQKNEIQKVEYNLVAAQLSALQANNVQAGAQLKLVPMALLSKSQLLRYHQTQARIAENNKDVIEAVRARSLMSAQFSENRLRQENNDQIWALLRNANKGVLSVASPGPGETEFAGWLALIAVYNQNVSTPAQMPQGINNWKQLYPNHSAVSFMPAELQNVSNFQQTQLNGVALLLPLSGDAKILGDIIKKGFNDAKGSDSIAVQTYDTESGSVESILAQAKQQGAQTIIGPLLKSRVDEMLISPEIKGVNVLALNSTPNVKAIPGVCYYGLSPEAEARAGADRLYRDGYSRAIVAAPQDDFGQRSADAFAQRWRQLTNTDADVRYYNIPQDSVVAIQNSGSTQGAALYTLGTAEQLLELKQGVDNSALAGQLAIYTSSRSNSPNNGIEFRTSMEGVKFSEIPLLSDTDSDEYKKADNLAASDFSMIRLYAMGSDAWALANKFNEFRQIPGYSVSGLTGNLTAGPNCNIEREMTWLQYRNGAVQSAN